MSLKLPKCDFCIHRHEDEGNEWNDMIYCDAFPDGKPLIEIPYEEKDECANGIKYEDEDGEYKEFIPEPGSMLAKMHRIGR